MFDEVKLFDPMSEQEVRDFEEEMKPRDNDAPPPESIAGAVAAISGDLASALDGKEIAPSGKNAESALDSFRGKNR